jgi:hypothetical protein
MLTLGCGLQTQIYPLLLGIATILPKIQKDTIFESTIQYITNFNSSDDFQSFNNTTVKFNYFLYWASITGKVVAVDSNQ